MNPKVRAQCHDRLVTFTRSIQGVERRTLTIDLWAPPTNTYEMQRWFIDLLGRIWWDVTETESFVATTRDADQMVALTQKFRDEQEQKDVQR